MDHVDERLGQRAQLVVLTLCVSGREGTLAVPAELAVEGPAALRGDRDTLGPAPTRARGGDVVEEFAVGLLQILANRTPGRRVVE